MICSTSYGFSSQAVGSIGEHLAEVVWESVDWGEFSSEEEVVCRFCRRDEYKRDDRRVLDGGVHFGPIVPVTVGNIDDVRDEDGVVQIEGGGGFDIAETEAASDGTAEALAASCKSTHLLIQNSTRKSRVACLSFLRHNPSEVSYTR
jgi:hypothetical protein